MSDPLRAALDRVPTVALIPAAVVASDAPLGGPPFHVHDIRFVAALFFACVIAPLIETLVFQWVVIGGLRRFFHVGARRTILVSAMLFRLAHLGYSAEYAVRTVACGLVLGAPFWTTASVHALYNLIATFALSQLV
ncbi:hypothetical protein BHUM_02171c [Candidatus Burkholderia humilis]|nr:hypothetical protein BHUM_02171c [Candidatus Burkholderia humilis]